MRIKELILANCRGVVDTRIPFQAGMNLIVGVNGAGKSTVLEALTILLSKVLAELTTGIAPSPRGFEIDDIAQGKNTMDAQLQFNIEDEHQLLLQMIRQREKITSIENIREEKSFRSGVDVSTFRTETERTEEGAWLVALPERQPVKLKLKKYPMLLIFSVERARSTYEKTKKLKKVHPGYHGAFSLKRGFYLNDVVEWWESKDTIAQEAPNSSSAKQLAFIKETLKELCPLFSNWRLEKEEKNTKDLWVDKTIQTSRLNEAGELIETQKQEPIRVRQLSDGERSIIAMTFDIARRLILLNEKDDDPIRNGRGIVLIDEIDLHLHPQWQRKIVMDLPRVFPNIQFIATTHSPQVIGEAAPGHVILLREGGKVEVKPESLGRDSGWVLRHIMGTVERNQELQEGLNRIDEFIDADAFDKARERIARLREKFGNDPELIEAQACVDRWEFEDDEEDS